VARAIIAITRCFRYNILFILSVIAMKSQGNQISTSRYQGCSRNKTFLSRMAAYFSEIIKINSKTSFHHHRSVVTVLDRGRIDLFTVTLNPISLGPRENSSVPIRSDVRLTSPCLTKRWLALAPTYSTILANPLIRIATGKPGSVLVYNFPVNGVRGKHANAGQK